MKNEEIIRKIKGLLAKAEDHADDAESQNALLMAKKWMIKHHIKKEDLEDVEICSLEIRHFKVFEWWEELLASLIAEHFRVRAYYQWQGEMPTLYFYGLTKDLEYAQDVFDLSYSSLCFFTAHHLSQKKCLSKGEFRQSKDDYISGFLKALSDKFNLQYQVIEKQASSNLLILVGVPPQVQQNFRTMTQTFNQAPVQLPEVVSLETYKKAYQEALTLDLTLRPALEEAL
jgi:Protein of unknown function (DUF2786).